MSKVELITHSAHLGASPDDDALDLILRALSAKHGEEGEWSDKYGTRYEDDTILIHPYCWCEKEDCLWCGGSRCQSIDFEDIPHTRECYQSRLGLLREKHGQKEEWGWHVPMFTPRYKRYEADKKKLCKELGCDVKLGNEVHCTCGADAERRRQYDACECEWHMGKGIFRFGKATQAPNFWHKPSGFQVRWYKYIGRDMEIVGTVTVGELAKLITQDDINEVIDRGDKAAKTFAAMIASVNQT